MVYLDQSGEALAGPLRPGNRGAHTAADQVALAKTHSRKYPRSTSRESRSCYGWIPLARHTADRLVSRWPIVLGWL